MARQIQFGLLPFEPYEKDGISIVSAMRPANTVGGDYFDVIELGEGRLAIAVGDVAGKGMPAALLMALLQGSLRTLLSAGLRGEELVAKLNAHLCANIPSNRLDHALLRRARRRHRAARVRQRRPQPAVPAARRASRPARLARHRDGARDHDGDGLPVDDASSSSPATGSCSTPTA